jgi:hypothetical protein
MLLFVRVAMLLFVRVVGGDRGELKYEHMCFGEVFSYGKRVRW